MKKKIMCRAWELYRATIEKFPEVRSHVQFAICLKMAWAEATAPVKAAKKIMQGIATDGGAAMLQLCKGVAGKLRRRALDGILPDLAGWAANADAAEDAAQSIFADIMEAAAKNEYPIDKAGQPVPLARWAYNLAARAARSISGICCHHSSVSLDSEAAPTLAAAGDMDIKPFAAQIIAAVCTNEQEHKIMKMLAAGYTVREIAVELDSSKSTIDRIAQRVRARARQKFPDTAAQYA